VLGYPNSLGGMGFRSDLTRRALTALGGWRSRCPHEWAHGSKRRHLMKSLVRKTAVAVVAVFILGLTALPAQADPPWHPANADVYGRRNCVAVTPVGCINTSGVDNSRF